MFIREELHMIERGRTGIFAGMDTFRTSGAFCTVEGTLEIRQIRGGSKESKKINSCSDVS